MSIFEEWPDFVPRPELHVDITGGSLTLLSTSKLLNHADYGWNPAEVVGTIFKNGASAATLSISSSDGAITSSAVSVAQNDQIEIRFVFTGKLSWPWRVKAILRRSAFFTVPAGNSTVDFDASNNVMPVPGFDLAFGWDSASKLGVGFKVAGDDGASQDLTVSTRRIPAADESSTTIDLDSASTQTHTSSFTKTAATGEFEIETLLQSGTGSTRMEDRVALRFADRDRLAIYPTAFPTDDVLLVQSKTENKLKIGAPGR